MESVLTKSRESWVGKAVALSWFTIFYNLVEGLVSMAFGIAEESFALFGFGADSFIEVASAVLILWRFRREAHLTSGDIGTREIAATRGIGILFLILAGITAVSSSVQLWNGSHPDSTLPGIAISLASLSFMFYLWRAKLKVADALGSSAMKSDAACSLACIKLSGILLCGSTLYMLSPSLWWADGLAALGLSYFIGREGWGMLAAARSGAPACCGCSGS